MMMQTRSKTAHPTAITITVISPLEENPGKIMNTYALTSDFYLFIYFLSLTAFIGCRNHKMFGVAVH